MQIAALETFRQIAARGSIAAAARTLGCDPSVVSRSLAALEAELGVRLFQRSTRRLELTEAGARYLRRIEPAVDELVAAREEALGLVDKPHGRLRVTASSSYGQAVLGPLLRTFLADYPDVRVELILTDSLVDLVGERVDLAVRLGPRPVGDLIVARLATVRFYAVASPAYLRAAPDLHAPRDLPRHACLIATAAAQAQWTFTGDASVEALVVEGLVATSNTVALAGCARDGLGIAVLPDWLVDRDLASGRLVRVLTAWQVTTGGTEVGIWILYPSRSHLPAKARAFIDHLRGHGRNAQD